MPEDKIAVEQPGGEASAKLEAARAALVTRGHAHHSRRAAPALAAARPAGPCGRNDAAVVPCKLPRLPPEFGNLRDAHGPGWCQLQSARRLRRPDFVWSCRFLWDLGLRLRAAVSAGRAQPVSGDIPGGWRLGCGLRPARPHPLPPSRRILRALDAGLRRDRAA